MPVGVLPIRDRVHDGAFALDGALALDRESPLGRRLGDLGSKGELTKYVIEEHWTPLTTAPARRWATCLPSPSTWCDCIDRAASPVPAGDARSRPPTLTQPNRRAGECQTRCRPSGPRHECGGAGHTPTTRLTSARDP